MGRNLIRIYSDDFRSIAEQNRRERKKKNKLQFFRRNLPTVLVFGQYHTHEYIRIS